MVSPWFHPFSSRCFANVINSDFQFFRKTFGGVILRELYIASNFLSFFFLLFISFCFYIFSRDVYLDTFLKYCFFQWLLLFNFSRFSLIFFRCFFLPFLSFLFFSCHRLLYCIVHRTNIFTTFYVLFYL